MTRDERVTWWFVTATFLGAWWLAAAAGTVAFSWVGALVLLAAGFVVDAVLVAEDLPKEGCP